MAILVNWFEVSFDRKEFTLPVLAAPSWPASTEVLGQYPDAQIVRKQQQDGSIKLFFVDGTPNGDSATETVVMDEERRVASARARSVLVSPVWCGMKRSRRCGLTNIP